MSLVVYCPYFGDLPPWLGLTLRSAQMNPHVHFVFIGDRLPPSGFHISNVRGKNMSFVEYQARIQRLVPLTLQWRPPCTGFKCGSAGSSRTNKNNKVSDSRPLLGAAFAGITRSFDWWAWMDIDLVFGHINILPQARDVFCPLSVTPVAPALSIVRPLGLGMGLLSRGLSFPRQGCIAVWRLGDALSWTTAL